MTEFKKLTASVEDLQKELKVLQHTSHTGVETLHSSELLEETYERMQKVRCTGLGILVRMRKIVLKGREKDPNRQIYNEKMCEKIDHLYDDYCEVILGLWNGPSEGGNEEKTALTIYHRTAEDTMAFENYLHSLQDLYRELKIPPTSSPAAETVAAPKPTDTTPSADNFTSTEAPAAHTQLPKPPKPPKRDELLWLEEVLLASHADAVDVQEIPFFQRVTTAYHAHVMARAAAESWQQRVASDWVEVVAFEKSLREVLVAEEHSAVGRIAEQKREEKLAMILHIERAREERWRAEIVRRCKEHEVLKRRSELWRRSGSSWKELLANCPLPYRGCYFGGRGNAARPPSGNEVLRHLLEFIRQVRCTPEDPNIRTIRNNHPVFMEHYGHPCYRFHAAGILPQCDEGETPPEGDLCVCASILEFVENLLYALGYQVHYDAWEMSLEKRAQRDKKTLQFLDAPSMTTPPLSSYFVNLADEEPTSAGWTGKGASMPDFYFPCGVLASKHQYSSKGFEMYGERTFQLVEPDPVENAEEWMMWYDAFSAVQKALEEEVR